MLVSGRAVFHMNLIIKGQTYTSPTLQFYHKLKARSHVALASDELIEELFSGSQQPKAPLLSTHFDKTPLKSVRSNLTAAAEPPQANRETRALNSIYKPTSFIFLCSVQEYLIHPQPFFSQLSGS